MRCPNCGQGIEKGWSYCPRCGARFRRDFFSSVFEKMFSRMDREIRDMNRLMEKEIQAMDISPLFIRPFRVSAKGPNAQNPRQTKGSGFTIKIRRSGRNPPKVSVRTFGNVNKEMVREHVREQLGNLGFKRATARPAPVRAQEKQATGPKSVQEPRADVRRIDGRVVVNLEMPGVKSLDDIDIMDLESSLEVKARAGDKAYFKILTKPGRFRLSKKGFSPGILHLEFS